MKIFTKEECKELFIENCNIIKGENNKYHPTPGTKSLYISNKNKSLRDSINYYTAHLPNINKSQKWYHFLNDIKEIPTCLFCRKPAYFNKFEYSVSCKDRKCRNQAIVNKRKITEYYFLHFKKNYNNIISKNKINEIYENIVLTEQKQYSIFKNTELIKNLSFVNSLLYYTEHLIPIDYSKINDPNILKERMHIIYNNIKEIPICKTEKCENKCGFDIVAKRYFDHCSRSCINKDKKVRKKIDNTCLERYDVVHYFKSDEGRKRLKIQWENFSEEKKNKIQLKKEKTCLKHYGCTHHMKCPEIKDKHIESTFKIFDFNLKGGSFKIKKHPVAIHTTYQGTFEKFFIDTWLEYYSSETIRNGKMIVYKHNDKNRRYFPDFIITYPDGKKEIIEIKGTHPFFYKSIEDGTLLAKWNAAEKFIDDNEDYTNYVFILNNEIISKNDILNKYFTNK